MTWRDDASFGRIRVEHSIQGQVANVPASGKTGYAPGAILLLRTPVLGQSVMWRNQGTMASCLFVPEGPVYGYGFVVGGGPFDCTNGSTTSEVQEGNVISTDIPLVGHSASDDDDQVQAIVTAAKNYVLITGSADPLTAHDYVYGVLRSKCIPGWDIVAAGSHTSVGGNAAEAITIAGLLAGDIALVVSGGTDDTDTIRQSVVSANTLTVTSDADPLVAHIFHYVILRPRGTFKPSHYVAYAGQFTTIGGDAVEVITITGALATDIPIVTWGVSNDTDTILKAVLTANTLTVTCSADPSTAHQLTYAILREYS